MVRAFSSLGCAELELAAVLELARQYGLAAVELRALADTIDLPAYFQRRCGSPDKLAAVVAAAGVRVVALDASFQLGNPDEAQREELLALGPWAEALDGVPIRVFDGSKVMDAAMLAAANAHLAWWSQTRRRRSWHSPLLVETHDVLFTAAGINAFLAAMPAGTGILWDAFHTWGKGGEDPVQTWAAIKAAVRHIHVKDGVRVAPGQPLRHTLPGQGEFPLRALLTQLQADGYAHALSLEYGRKWHPYLPPLPEALAALKGWW